MGMLFVPCSGAMHSFLFILYSGPVAGPPPRPCRPAAPPFPPARRRRAAPTACAAAPPPRYRHCNAFPPPTHACLLRYPALPRTLCCLSGYSSTTSADAFGLRTYASYGIPINDATCCCETSLVVLAYLGCTARIRCHYLPRLPYQNSDRRI